VLDNSLRVATAVLTGVLEQFAELLIGQALPDHWHPRRRQVPVGSARGRVQSAEVMVLVTGAASHDAFSRAVQSAVNLHRVRMAVVSLPGIIAFGMAVHTTRMMQDRNKRFKRGRRSGIITMSCELLGLRTAATDRDYSESSEKDAKEDGGPRQEPHYCCCGASLAVRPLAR